MSRALAVRIRTLCGGTFGAACAFFGGTLALLELLPIHAALHVDTARDLLLARDCVIGVHCSGAGPRSSFGGWMQGALWSHVLELRESLGLGLAALEHVASVALAAAAALVPVAARACGRPVSALTWALWFPATLWTIGHPTLWNPTLSPLALGLFHVALAHAARTRGLLAFAAAAAALALAVDVHVGSAVLLPCLLAAVVACAARPWLALPTVAAVAVVVMAVDSPGAFAENRERLAGHAPLLALALALAASAGLLVRRRLLRGEDAARADAIVKALCVFLIVVFPVMSVWTCHPLHARYLAPLVTPAALLLGRGGRARIFAGPRRRAAAAALVCLAYGARWRDDRLYNPRFRLVEVEAVAAALYGRGLGFGELYARLRGPYAFDLLSTLAALEPPAREGAATDDRDLLVVRAARADLPDAPPPGWVVVDLGGSWVAVIVPYHPWVQIDPLEVCRAPATSPDARTCATIAVAGTRFAPHPRMRWADRAFAQLPGIARPDRGDQVAYRLSLRPDHGGAGRRIRLLADDCKGWRVTRAGAAEGGGAAIDVAADGAAGELVFTVTASPRCRWWLPPFAELDAHDPALGRLLPPLPLGHAVPE